MALFTEGERRWAERWVPHYPEPTRREGPGAVFTTAHGGHQTTWVMVDHQPGLGEIDVITDTAAIVAATVIAAAGLAAAGGYAALGHLQGFCLFLRVSEVP